MFKTHVLLIENDEDWYEILRRVLGEAFGEGVEFAWAKDYSEARQKIENEEYDLISVDLSIPEPDNWRIRSDLPGMVLLRDIRNNSRNSNCGLIILSGLPTFDRARIALGTYRVYYFFTKDEFNEERDSFIEKARSAVRLSLLERAAASQSERCKFAISFDRNGFLHAELSGLGHRKTYRVTNPPTVDFATFARQADTINTHLVRGDVGEWRNEARLIGEKLYEALIGPNQLLEGLTIARALTRKKPSNLTLEFSGPPEGLSFPFELMRNDSDYLALEHVITRNISGSSNLLGLAEPFVTFVESRLQSHETMRVLVVGSNVGGTIPAAEEEARSVADLVDSRLEQLAIPHHVTRLIGTDVSCDQIKQALQSGYHMLHYAGHGAYDEALPEGSALLFCDGFLTASDLKVFLLETELRIAFLSCCLGARNASQVGRGDFHGLFHALSQSGVPLTIGHRWEVVDDEALGLAREFYENLFRSFCPGLALLRARQTCTVRDRRRDDSTWASPVLLQ